MTKNEKPIKKPTKKKLLKDVIKTADEMELLSSILMEFKNGEKKNIINTSCIKYKGW